MKYESISATYYRRWKMSDWNDVPRHCCRPTEIGVSECNSAANAYAARNEFQGTSSPNSMGMDSSTNHSDGKQHVVYSVDYINNIIDTCNHLHSIHVDIYTFNHFHFSNGFNITASNHFQCNDIDISTNSSTITKFYNFATSLIFFHQPQRRPIRHCPAQRRGKRSQHIRVSTKAIQRTTTSTAASASLATGSGFVMTTPKDSRQKLSRLHRLLVQQSKVVFVFENFCIQSSATAMHTGLVKVLPDTKITAGTEAKYSAHRAIQMRIHVLFVP